MVIVSSQNGNMFLFGIRVDKGFIIACELQINQKKHKLEDFLKQEMYYLA
jgi:hypothetical protein